MMVIAEFPRHLTSAEWVENGSEKNRIAFQGWESVRLGYRIKEDYFFPMSVVFLPAYLGSLPQDQYLGNIFVFACTDSIQGSLGWASEGEVGARCAPT
jgi:hypothetical protein